MKTKSGPYIGPEPFKTEHAGIFFGREREKHELASLVAAHQVVVLYSPSGAGKSSLINAGLIPLLRAKERFAILPPIRFLGTLPKDADPARVNNPYLFDTVTALAGAAPPEVGVNDSSLAETLDRINQQMASAEEPLMPVLLFDQFEEIFFRYQDFEEHWIKRGQFFEKLGEVLAKDRTVRVVIAMREEYLAQFDRHAQYLPDAWGARYRLELLDNAAAFDAVTLPLAGTGYAFENDAANWLVADLRRSRVESSTAQTQPVTEVAGEFVEPVQLQVVCLSLWERRNEFPNPITQKSLHEIGNVDQALTKFYDDTVAAAATAATKQDQIDHGDATETTAMVTGNEIKLREWIEHALISSNHTRRLTDLASLQEAKIQPVALQELVDRHLVRKNERYGGLAWYELTHDRLILPIQKSNEVVFARSLQPFQRQARLWKEQDEPPDLLLRGTALDEATAYAAANAERLQDDERRFVRQSQDAQQRIRDDMRRVEEAKQAQLNAERLRMVEQQAQFEAMNASRLRTRFFAAVAFAGIAVIATAVALYFFSQARHEEGQAKDARATAVAQSRSRQVAAQALRHVENQLDLALLLGVAANDNAVTADSETSLLTALTKSPHLTVFLDSKMQRANGVAMRPDGQMIAVSGCAEWKRQGCVSAAIGLWSRTPAGWTESGVVANADGLTEITALAFGPDGQMLAAVGQEGLTIWNLTDNSRRTSMDSVPLDGCQQSIYNSVAFNPTTGTLYTGGNDGCLVSWDVDMTSPPQLIEKHDQAITRLAISPDGRWLGWGDTQGVVLLSDLTNPESVPVRQAELGSEATGVAFNFDGTLLASSGRKGKIVLTNVPGGPAVSMPAIEEPSGGVLSLAFSPIANVLAVGDGSNDSIILIVDIEKQASKTLAWHRGPIPGLAFGPDGTTLVSVERNPTGGQNATISVWNTESDLPLAHTLSPLSCCPQGIAVAPNGTLMAIGTGDGLELMDLNGQAWTPVLDGDRTVTSVAFDQSGTLLVGGGSSGTTLWDVTTGRQLLTVPVDEHGQIVSVAISPDGSVFATGAYDGTVTIWHVQDSSNRAGPSLPDQEVMGLAFSPDGSLLAAGWADGSIELWDVAKNRVTGTKPAKRTSAVTSVAFSPDGKLLASSGADQTLIVWDVIAGAARGAPLTGHEGKVQSVAFSPDGTLLASGGIDGTILLWDVKSGSSIEPPLIAQTAASNYSPTWRVAFGKNPDGGQVLVSAGSDGTVIVWDVDLTSWRTKACRLANRRLTEDEWARYEGDEPFRETCGSKDPRL